MSIPGSVNQNQVYPNPPPPQGYNPPPPQHTTVVYNQQPVPYIAPKVVFGEESMRANCPNCKADVMTCVTYETGNMTYITAAICCIFGGVFGCFLIPFFVKEFKDVVHTCPTCNTWLGRYRRG